MSLYTPILVLGAIAAVFAVFSVGTALVIGPEVTPVGAWWAVFPAGG